MKVISRTIVGNRSPRNKNVSWIDTSGGKAILKYYINGEWTSVDTLSNGLIENTPNTSATQGVLNMYIPEDGTYDKESFETISGVDTETFLLASGGLYRWVRKHLSPFGTPVGSTNSGTDSDWPAVAPGPHQSYVGEAIVDMPIMSMANHSSQYYFIKVFGDEGIWSISYSSNQYTVSFTSY